MGVKIIKCLPSLILVFFLVLPFQALILSTQYSFGVEATFFSGTPRGKRTDNEDIEPNNSFGTATKVTYNSTGTRKIVANFSSVINDPVDFWQVPIDLGTKQYSGANLTGANNATKLKIQLVDINVTGSTGKGVYMKVYDAERHKLAETTVAVNGTPNAFANFEVVGQVNSYIYLRVLPNVPDSTGFYGLTIQNFSEINNPAFDDDNRFVTATEFNITVGATYNDYLDYTHDNADFYKFNALKNQEIKLKLISLSNCDFDIYLFDSLDPFSWIKGSESTGWGLGEDIYYNCDIDKTLHVRIVVKINGTIIGGRGNYQLECSGNLIPYWNTSFQDVYKVEEDFDPLHINLDQAFYDINPNDEIELEIKGNSPTTSEWKKIPSTLYLENITIYFQMSNTTQTPELIIYPGKDKS